MEQCVVVGRGLNYANAFEFAIKLMETCYVVAERFSGADFLHGPIAVAEPGLPVLLIGAGGSVSKDLESIAARLTELGCRVIGLFDAASAPLPEDAAVRIATGLPEELTPIPLAVLGQLLACSVAVARGVDPDAPRILRKVTRTW
jgi:glucosamine--fructose-6-phosphate aminotransferase (isomerizing)